ncbi:MAG TPA: hypothetical protein VGN27_06135 [Gaiellaceae bacterium]|nr:hypothetical protein [Gaiellaceae bacterium]
MLSTTRRRKVRVGGGDQIFGRSVEIARAYAKSRPRKCQVPDEPMITIKRLAAFDTDKELRRRAELA